MFLEFTKVSRHSLVYHTFAFIYFPFIRPLLPQSLSGETVVQDSQTRGSCMLQVHISFSFVWVVFCLSVCVCLLRGGRIKIVKRVRKKGLDCLEDLDSILWEYGTHSSQCNSNNNSRHNLTVLWLDGTNRWLFVLWTNVGVHNVCDWRAVRWVSDADVVIDNWHHRLHLWSSPTVHRTYTAH